MPDRTESIVALTEELVRFRTTKDRPEAIEDCLAFIADRFDDPVYTVNRYEYNDTPSLLVGFGDPEEADLLLHGHIDVVEASDELFDPSRDGDRLYGRGTADMKAGVACLIHVMEELAEREEPPSVALLLVSDEELGGFDGVGRLVEDAVLEPSFAISAEPNNQDNYMAIITKQKGVLRLKLVAEGENAHGSRPWLGENAAEQLIDRYDAVRELFPDGETKTWATTVNLGRLEGGVAANQVPDTAEAMLDVRWSEQYPADEVIADVKDVDGLDVEVVANQPMLDTPDDDRHVQALQDAAETVIGEEVPVMKKEPASDMRFFTAEDVPAVVFGPEGYNAHGPEEYAVISSFEGYVASLLTFIDRR